MDTVRELLERGDAEDPAILAPGGTQLSYAELRAAVDQLAAQLCALNITSADRVAIVLPNGPEMAIAFLAVSSCATAAPLNPRFHESEFRFYLQDLGAKALITLPGHGEKARAAAPGNMSCLTIEGPRDALFLSAERGAPDPDSPSFAKSDDIALVLHTSGTTSRPKLVPLTQRHLTVSARNIVGSLALSPSDRGLHIMPLFHIHGLVAGLLAPLWGGGSVACTPGFDAFRFFDWLDTFRPTWYTAVPSMHQAILGRATRNAATIQRNPLRFVRSSSASLPAPVMEEMERLFHAPVIEAYGMTEATHQITSNPLPPQEVKARSVGRATGVEIAVMDNAGRLLAVDQIGEVVIKGPTVLYQYENNPDANVKAFSEGWFRTGDQGYVDADGYLFLTGRLKEIINRGGEKISPLEVDDVLLRHPAVQCAVAFGMPHKRLGEEVYAAVVLTAGSNATEQELRQFAAQYLIEFKVPRKVVIVDDIPRGPSGKLQRIGLAEKLGLAPKAKQEVSG